MKKAMLSICLLLSAHLVFAQWTTSGNNIYNSNSGYVGIGGLPGCKLNVADSSNNAASAGTSVGSFTVNNRYAGTGSNIATFVNSNASASSQLVFYTAAQYASGIQAQNYGTATASTLTLNPLGGNVGIGLTNPSNKLEVYLANTFTSTNINTYEMTLIQNGSALGIGGYSSGSVLQSFNGLPLFLNPIGNNVIIDGLSANNVLIGKSSQVNTTYRLDVNGTIRANGVTVNTTGADFVFDSTYQLPTLGRLGEYVRANHHLPGVEPASQMQKEGVNLGEFATKLLQKVEELTLYSVQSDQKLSEQQAILEQLQQQIKSQQKDIEQLKDLIKNNK